MARVDFFIDKNTGDLYFNEVNTIPGFTSNTPDFEHAVPLALRVSGIVRFDDQIVPSSAGSTEPRAK